MSLSETRNLSPDMSAALTFLYTDPIGLLDLKQNWHWQNESLGDFLGKSVDFDFDWFEESQSQKIRSAAHQPNGQFEIQILDAHEVLRSFKIRHTQIPDQGVLFRWEDITELRTAQNEALQQSTHDPLTHLFNRSFFEAELDRVDRGRSFPISVIHLDLACLRPINDALGHAYGDQILLKAAELLSKTLRGEDILARLGGSEFGILLTKTGGEGTRTVLDRIRNAFIAHNQNEDGLNLEYAVGSASAEGPGRTREAQKEADRRMQAEKMGRKTRRDTI
jgi:diguanylate cyclase (GGDEF)-like protein